MEEQTQPQGEAVANEPSLEDVISEYSVSAPPSQEAAPSTTQAPPQIPTKVDPLDEQSFSEYANTVSQGQSVLVNQLSEVKSELTRLRQEQAERQIEADINKAVDVISEGTQADQEFARVFLEYKAQKEPGLKAIWDNRNTNQKAYNAAMKALNREFSKKYSAMADPELTANQQAIQQSQQSMATRSTSDGSGNPIQDRLDAAKSPAEFDRIWRELSNASQ